MYLQSGAATCRKRFCHIFSESSPCLLGSCSTAQQHVEHPKSKSTQPRSARRWVTLYICCSPIYRIGRLRQEQSLVQKAYGLGVPFVPIALPQTELGQLLVLAQWTPGWQFNRIRKLIGKNCQELNWNDSFTVANNHDRDQIFGLDCHQQSIPIHSNSQSTTTA